MIFKCSHCHGEVVYKKGIGWGHTIATGCIKPAVTKEDWDKYLKSKSEVSNG